MIQNCLLSLFYIKPQLSARPAAQRYYCLLSLFYIKPQLIPAICPRAFNCLLSLFYIKPQHAIVVGVDDNIVFYLYSTSNHNWLLYLLSDLNIVFYLYSTSNHN